MNAHFLIPATLVGLVAGFLPAQAADAQLLGLVMPDAKVLAGVNVTSAKASVFGQYVLSQMQNGGFEALAAATGFNPTQDVNELLVATDNPGKSGLAAVSGAFDGARILQAATGTGDVVTETYDGVTVIEDKKQTHGLAFLGATIAVAGDLASVKAALDRQKAAASLPAALSAQVQQWSTSEDAWVITTVPPSSLQPAPGAPKIPGVGVAAAQGTMQNIQSAAAGVKFGDVVVVTAQAQADNAQDATGMANALKLLVSLAQLQNNGQDPNLQALAQALQVSAQGSTVNISISLPETTLQGLVKPHNAARRRPLRQN